MGAPDVKETGAILTKQKMLKNSIERSLANFKKVGQNNWTPAKIRSRIQNLKETWQSFQDGHGQICGVVPEEDRDFIPYFTEDHISLVEEVFLDTLDFMRDALEQLEPPPSPAVPSAADVSLHEALTRMATPAPALTPLPPIRIPLFNGSYGEWESFRDRFTSLVRDNKTLNNCARMHYLVSSVTGPALDCIRTLSVTADNFPTAWKALESRFENPRRLVSHYLTALLSLPTVTRENVAELQTLRDKASLILSSLQNLGRTAESLWDDMLVHLVSQRLDAATRKAWTLQKNDKVFPSFEELNEFILTRVRALEELNPGGSKVASKPSTPPRVTVANASAKSSLACPLCQGSHFMNNCSSFVKQKPSGRRELVRLHKRCFNCLSQHHSVSECPSKHSCRLCSKRHHTTLHDSSDTQFPSQHVPPSTSLQIDSAPRDVTALHSHSLPRYISSILLATAWVTVGAQHGRTAVVRALLDQGSVMTFISENLAQRLRVNRIRLPMSIEAVGGVYAGSPRHAAHISVSPRASRTPAIHATASILRNLTSYIPPRIPKLATFPHLSGLELADPDPTSPAEIDIIIGADLYNDLFLEGVRNGLPGQPLAQKTIFGWVLTGSRKCSSTDNAVNSSSFSDHSNRTIVHHSLISPPLDDALTLFWTLEEIPSVPILKPSDIECEEHFQTTHHRDASGRYIVRLPFKTAPPIGIGHSRTTAERMIRSLHRRFKSNPTLYLEYCEFLNEYERLDHMVRTSLPQNPNAQTVYIPHHPVLREDSLTSHLRVVFNASSLTSNGTSLNDHLLTGPKLQSDLVAVILRWRQWQFVYSADIAKMYRQILVDPQDVDYQRILWQSDPSKPIAEFQLRTVTYGTVCAPFLALRVLKQLVQDEGRAFPLASLVLRDNLYVDDVLFGANSIDSLKSTRDQLLQLFRRGCFSLRKWAGNSPSLLSDIDPADHGLACDKNLAVDESLKVLGIRWTPGSDAFQYSVNPFSSPIVTKRSILSFIARLFDPLGWVTPVIIKTKIFMQTLWREQIDWDSPLTEHLEKEWTTIAHNFMHLSSLTIPRWTGFSSDIQSIQFHGFSDASNSAYAAVVYLRVVSSSGSIMVTLLAGKSKVAPLHPITVPRLELCAAVLLSRLVRYIADTLNFSTAVFLCWTDSTVTREWISQHPSRWKVFVGNRVAKIQTLLPQATWRHVPTEDNPADCASRGLLGNELLNHPLWWTGPSWLYLPQEHWPQDSKELSSAVQVEARSTNPTCLHTFESWDLVNRFSSWQKLLRVTTYMIKFISRCRRQKDSFDSSLTPYILNPNEFRKARIFWLKYIQSELFSTEIISLRQGRNIPSHSKLLGLCPFLDSNQLLRVGGRISQAPSPYEIRHPIILASHPLVNLIIVETHLHALHAGPQLTLHLLRHEFWILRARSLVRHAIQKCIPCVRERSATPTQLMGELPKVRVTPTFRSFLHTGVDYAGPILIRSSSQRGCKSIKAYIALFVCLTSKAIHLELVSDYSTSAFKNAFARFCSRRGLPQSMYCDNGTNFVGASRELTKAYRTAIRDPNFLNSTVADHVTWHFIPPSAPHFGGLWEAGVRSVKGHLSRVLGDRALTFEEFYTVLCRIEACLNSRPLGPLSDSLDDYEYLTPGHLAVGSALTVPPEPSVLDLNVNRLSRWQLVQQITERFWRLWQHDYVNTLQQRSKWRQVQPTIEVGRVVLLRNSKLPPCKWELGRVIQCHPGADGLPRVVTVKTATSQYKRPIGKLCLLPVRDETKEGKSIDSVNL